jgi:hypothetical protein
LHSFLPQSYQLTDTIDCSVLFEIALKAQAASTSAALAPDLYADIDALVRAAVQSDPAFIAAEAEDNQPRSDSF